MPYSARYENFTPDMVNICMNGSCFKLYILLKQIYPDATPWYDHDHIITEIAGRFWDIRGEVLPSPRHIRMSDDALLFNGAYFWGVSADCLANSSGERPNGVGV